MQIPFFASDAQDQVNLLVWVDAGNADIQAAKQDVYVALHFILFMFNIYIFTSITQK